MTDAFDLKQHIADVPDFPIEGVTFRDIAPLLQTHFEETIDVMDALFTKDEIQKVDCFAGLDARGFIFASAMAARHGKNLLVIRKGGKLPPPVIGREYDLEYGSARIEIKPGHGRVIIVDDLIATGGSMLAAADLCKEAGYEVLAMACLIDLTFLNDFEWNGQTVRSAVQYHD